MITEENLWGQVKISGGKLILTFNRLSPRQVQLAAFSGFNISNSAMWCVCDTHHVWVCIVKELNK